MPEIATIDVTKTGVIGLGQMGKSIARNLDAGGLLCAAFDAESSAFAAAELSDRVANAPPDRLVEQADILLFAVPSTTEIEEFFGAHVGRAGQVVLDVTTSDPAQSAALAGRLAKQGVAYIDAAMTGGAAGADAGALTLMIGGDSDDVAKCQPVIETISAKHFHLGTTGSGHAMKLVHNLILHSSFLANCEGLKLAERAGIDPSRAVEVLNAGNARSFVSEVRFPRDILSGTMMCRSHIANLEKDLGLAMDFAADQNARVPYGAMTRSVLAQALEAGHADTDFSWLFSLYEDLIDQMETDK